MKLITLLTEIATLVESRKIIDHGNIRCLYSDEARDSIHQAEGCEKVDTATIGYDELAKKLINITQNPKMLMDVDTYDLADMMWELDASYRGDDIEGYLDRDKENELGKLDDLISAAKKFSDLFFNSL